MGTLEQNGKYVPFGKAGTKREMGCRKKMRDTYLGMLNHNRRSFPLGNAGTKRKMFVSKFVFIGNDRKIRDMHIFGNAGSNLEDVLSLLGTPEQYGRCLLFWECQNKMKEFFFWKSLI